MNAKKAIWLNLPYLLFVYPFDKLAQAFRLAPGINLSDKLLSIGDGFTAAVASWSMSFDSTDLLLGLAGAALLRLVVYMKGKGAKKYRHGIEYGSARWGTAADIAPYMDKQTKLRYNKLTEEEKQQLIRIMQKSELMKTHIPQRGKRN